MKYICKDIGLSIEIQDKLLNQLYAEGMKHYLKEFGGLLIGKYSDDFKTCLIETTILSTKYKSSLCSFKRKKAGLMEKLTEYYNSEPKLFYIGEWHTHTDSEPYPSTMDKKAMKKIEKNNNVNITSPILLIIGLNKKSYQVNFYVQHRKELYIYEKEN